MTNYDPKQSETNNEKEFLWANMRLKKVNWQWKTETRHCEWQQHKIYHEKSKWGIRNQFKSKLNKFNRINHHEALQTKIKQNKVTLTWKTKRRYYKAKPDTRNLTAHEKPKCGIQNGNSTEKSKLNVKNSREAV